MTPDQSLILIKSVLKSKGWKNLNTNWALPPDGDFLSDKCPRDDNGQPLLLTSHDACKEVFEKDATAGYWVCLFNICNPNWEITSKLTNRKEWILTLKATPRQRCEAWVEWMKQENKP